MHRIAYLLDGVFAQQRVGYSYLRQCRPIEVSSPGHARRRVAFPNVCLPGGGNTALPPARMRGSSSREDKRSIHRRDVVYLSLGKGVREK